MIKLTHQEDWLKGRCKRRKKCKVWRRPQVPSLVDPGSLAQDLFSVREEQRLFFFCLVCQYSR